MIITIPKGETYSSALFQPDTMKKFSVSFLAHCLAPSERIKYAKHAQRTHELVAIAYSDRQPSIIIDEMSIEESVDWLRVRFHVLHWTGRTPDHVCKTVGKRIFVRPWVNDNFPASLRPCDHLALVSVSLNSADIDEVMRQRGAIEG